MNSVFFSSCEILPSLPCSDALYAVIKSSTYVRQMSSCARSFRSTPSHSCHSKSGFSRSSLVGRFLSYDLSTHSCNSNSCCVFGFHPALLCRYCPFSTLIPVSYREIATCVSNSCALMYLFLKHSRQHPRSMCPIARYKASVNALPELSAPMSAFVLHNLRDPTEKLNLWLIAGSSLTK